MERARQCGGTQMSKEPYLQETRLSNCDKKTTSVTRNLKFQKETQKYEKRTRNMKRDLFTRNRTFKL